MFYTNGSSITKTFHGVTFQPGETKEVFGYINDPYFYISSKRQEPPKRERRDTSVSENLASKKESKREVKEKVKEKVKEDSKEVILDNNELNEISESENPNKT